MPLLRLNEHYTSIQGEGPNVGLLTQFVRLAGCNMRCPGWPCDTQHAIQPLLWKNDPKVTGSDILDLVFREAMETGAKHVCITGGEPFMSDNNQLRALCMELLDSGYTIDFFTNGSFLFPAFVMNQNITINLDWKLGGSGEAKTALDNRTENVIHLLPKDNIKFVVKDNGDLFEAVEMWSVLRQETRAKFYVGRAWDTLSDEDIVDFIKLNKLPWRLNVQLHKYIFPGRDRGI